MNVPRAVSSKWSRNSGVKMRENYKKKNYKIVEQNKIILINDDLKDCSQIFKQCHHHRVMDLNNGSENPATCP